MGSSEISLEILQLLINLKEVKVTTVWTNAPRPAGRGQVYQKTPVATFIKQQFPNIQLREPEHINQEEINYLVAHPVDFIMVAAYGHILPPKWLKIPQLGCFNIHFSLLPKYRGASPIPEALLNGDEETGVTIQKVNEKLDAGDIALSRSFSLKNLNAPQAFAESFKIVKLILPEFIRKLIKRDLKLAPQNNFLVGSYCRKVKKKDGLIEPPISATKIYRKFLAYQPWPGVYFKVEGVTFIINDLEKVSKMKFNDLFKEIFSIYGKNTFGKNTFFQSPLCLFKLTKPTRLILATRTINSFNASLVSKTVTSSEIEFLNITAIQKSGKKPLPIKEFLNGIKWVFPINL